MTGADQDLHVRKQQQTRDTLVQAAIEIIRDKGTDALSMPEVASRAGVSLRTVYRYVESREALLRAAVSRVADELRPETTPSGFAQLPAAFLGLADRLQQHPDVAALLASTPPSVLGDVFGREADTHVGALVDALPTDARRVAALDIRPVIAFLSSPQGVVTIEAATGCTPVHARRAVVSMLAMAVASLATPSSDERRRRAIEELRQLVQARA